MTAFDLTTSYTADYSLVDLVEATSWIYGSTPTTVTGLMAQWGDFSFADMSSVAAGIGLSSEAAAVVVWQASASTTFAPQQGHILSGAVSGRWIIHSFVQVEFGHWNCICEKEVTNADVTS